MAIQFARAEIVSRSTGGSATRLGAYIARDTIIDERTGERHRFPDKHGTLIHADVMLPDGADPKFKDPSVLWNAVERAERRRDSQVARHIVLPLPRDAEISNDERIALAREFVQKRFVDKGLAAHIAVHDEPGNPHAHLLVTTRRIEGGTLAPRKFLDAEIRYVHGHPIVVDGQRFGELWRDHQDDWFRRHGKPVAVDPVAPEPGQHIGPKRFRHPQDPRIAANDRLQKTNAEIARDPVRASQHLNAQKRLGPGSIAKFVAKHISDPVERVEAQVEISEKLRGLQRDALETAAGADKTQSGLRELMVEDVAREMSPAYASLVAKANKLRESIGKADWVIRQQELGVTESKFRQETRRGKMGTARKLLHATGVPILQDIDLKKATDRERQNEWGKHRWSIKRAALNASLDMTERQAKIVLDTPGKDGKTLRQNAAAELDARKRVARNARAAIDIIDRNDRLALRAHREHRRGHSP